MIHRSGNSWKLMCLESWSYSIIGLNLQIKKSITLAIWWTCEFALMRWLKHINTVRIMNCDINHVFLLYTKSNIFSQMLYIAQNKISCQTPQNDYHNYKIFNVYLLQSNTTSNSFVIMKAHNCLIIAPGNYSKIFLKSKSNLFFH